MTITTQPFSQTICRRNKHSVRLRQETPERHLRNLQSDESNVCSFFSEPYVSLCPSKKKKKFESTFQSQSHVLKVAASLIWKEIFSYEAVNTSQSLLTGTLTCVLARPRVSSFFFFWILVHNQFSNPSCWKGLLLGGRGENEISVRDRALLDMFTVSQTFGEEKTIRKSRQEK